MHILVVVNDATAIEPSQTTAMLINAALAQGHDLWVSGVGDLGCDPDGRPWAFARPVAAGAHSRSPAGLAKLVQPLAQSLPLRCWLEEVDLLLLRTNPARDTARGPAHGLALALAQRCAAQGLRVVNHPDGLHKAATKLYLMELPDSCRPRSLVSQSPGEILKFVHSLGGPAVLKPLQGTRGSDVFLIPAPSDPNINQIIEVILRQGPVMAQACIPGAERGDTRVVVMDGKMLSLGGAVAAIRRVPAAGDFRSNIHAGGKAEPGLITDAMVAVVQAIGPKLVADGLRLVGLDFIGAQLVEINVFSTGGLRDAERFTGQDFSAAVMAALTQG
jgi:glutathione synthase